MYLSFFRHLFEILWSTQLPCFDAKGTRSMLKACMWKGMKVPCSAIFKTMPTDRGMCCSFNLKAASKLFTNREFVQSVEKMQKRDEEIAILKKSLNIEIPLMDSIP